MLWLDVVAAQPALPVSLGAAPTPRGPLVVRAVLGAVALQAGLGLNQGAVDREVLLD